jgi:hypothetical protein
VLTERRSTDRGSPHPGSPRTERLRRHFGVARDDRRLAAHGPPLGRGVIARSSWAELDRSESLSNRTGARAISSGWATSHHAYCSLARFARSAATKGRPRADGVGVGPAKPALCPLHRVGREDWPGRGRCGGGGLGAFEDVHHQRVTGNLAMFDRWFPCVFPGWDRSRDVAGGFPTGAMRAGSTGDRPPSRRSRRDPGADALAGRCHPRRRLTARRSWSKPGRWTAEYAAQQPELFNGVVDLGPGTHHRAALVPRVLPLRCSPSHRPERPPRTPPEEWPEQRQIAHRCAPGRRRIMANATPPMGARLPAKSCARTA